MCMGGGGVCVCLCVCVCVSECVYVGGGVVCVRALQFKAHNYSSNIYT